MYKDTKLTANQLKNYEDVWTDVAGSCMINWEWMETVYKLTEDEVHEILEDADVMECHNCNWWQYPGDYCSEHECHDEITCTDCCEEEDDD
jgi:hypothetical protein